MTNLAETLTFTPADFLEWEAHQETRHEFVNGEVFAMTGGTDWHNVISLNTAFILRARFDTPPCRVFMGDVKVAVAHSESFFYPDVFVTCAETDQAQRLAKQSPLLIVEVLSPGTEGYDRGVKFEHYRRIDSLYAYLLVAQDRPHVDLYTRDDLNRWTLQDCDDLDGSLSIERPDWQLTLSMAQIYRDVEFMPVEPVSGTST
ncbi:MAG: Uma2 family endonuclease [Halothiobacillaceae bacterium]